jgi:hypothetical protein
MAHHISQLESELQNIPEAAPKASPSFSVSEKLARYGSSALFGVEHLTNLARWQRVCRSRPDSSLWFAQGFGSRFTTGTAAIPSTA